MIPAVYLLVGLIFSDQLIELSQSTTTVENADLTAIFAFVDSLKDFNFGYILTMFLFYFLFGYLLYSSLFAAIGAIIGDDLEVTIANSDSYTSSYSLLYWGCRCENPNSSLAAWSCVFPLFRQWLCLRYWSSTRHCIGSYSPSFSNPWILIFCMVISSYLSRSYHVIW